MGIKRVVDTDFWTDDKVMMEFSPEDRLFMLYLLTNPHTTQLGVYKILPKQMAFELGYSMDTIGVLLDRFSGKYNIIRYSKETSEIAVKNYLKYSIVKGGKPVLDLLTREAGKVKNRALLSFIAKAASGSGNETVRAFCAMFNDNENVDENENENVNDNDDSLVRIDSTIRTTIRPRFVPPSLDEVKDYCAERRNDVDAERFVDYYTANGWLVGKNKMKDWRAAVRTWERGNNSTYTPKAQPRKKGSGDELLAMIESGVFDE